MCAAVEALGLVRDPRALDLLRSLEVAHGCGLPYVRARAAHGDHWAIRELLAAARDSSLSSLADEADGVIDALLLVDTPGATEAIRRHVRDTWPERWRSFDGDWDHIFSLGGQRMQNYAGDARRTTALGEAARREPRWLAEFALEKMGSGSLSARVCGVRVFRGLTGRSFGFRPEAFAAERATPLAALRDWWAKHEAESREQWLLSYFRERGLSMTRLWEQSSLPALVEALSADPVTHDLAVEQISVITGKYFADPAPPWVDPGTLIVADDERPREDAVRIKGWLAARKLLPVGR
jgi:hypothetical protein